MLEVERVLVLSGIRTYHTVFGRDLFRSDLPLSTFSFVAIFHQSDFSFPNRPQYPKIEDSGRGTYRRGRVRRAD